MKKIFLTAVLAAGCLAMEAQRQKVILDTDMVEIFDDGISMMMLADAPNVDLIGVTTVTGNTWMCEGTAYAVRQLEALKKTDIPVLMGCNEGLRPSRHAAIEHERMLYGIGVEEYSGSFSYADPKDWEKFYEKTYGAKPTMKLTNTPAAQFIVEQVRKYPGEITIAAIGPCTNLALAVTMAPDIVDKVKEIVYMGGSFFVQGNSTPNAEFNWWCDPEGARITLAQKFKKQTIVGLDVCNKVLFDKTRWEKIKATVKNPILKDIFAKHFLNDLYKDANYQHKIWDVIATALIIDPTLLTEEVVKPVDISTDFGFSYGQSMVYTVRPSFGASEAHIVMDVDSERLWRMIEEYIRRW